MLMKNSLQISSIYYYFNDFKNVHNFTIKNAFMIPPSELIIHVQVHAVPFTKTVYIERSDFREVDSPDYFRMAPGKPVGLLKVPYPVTATTVEKDPSSGKVTVVHARYEKPADGGPPKKPKRYYSNVAKEPRCLLYSC